MAILGTLYNGVFVDNMTEEMSIFLKPSPDTYLQYGRWLFSFSNEEVGYGPGTHVFDGPYNDLPTQDAQQIHTTMRPVYLFTK
jgi:hypothetical protein